jgi:hypothetical protein
MLSSPGPQLDQIGAADLGARIDELTGQLNEAQDDLSAARVGLRRISEPRTQLASRSRLRPSRDEAPRP